MTTRARAELALIAVTLVWGATFVVVKNALDHISTLLFLVLRFGVGTVALVLVFRHGIFAQPQLRKVTIRAGLLAGICLVTAYFFQTLGLRHTTPSKSAFVTGLSAALVPFLAAIVYRTAPHVSEIAGAAAATMGLGLLTLPPGRLEIGYGDALTLCCTVGFALHILILGRWSPVSNFALLSTLQIATVAVLATLGMGLLETPSIVWNPPVVIAIGVTGLLTTAVAFSVMAWAQRHTTATRAALIFTLEPVSAYVTAYLVEGERFTGRALAGAVLILSGILLVELKPIGPSRHP
jgi:drug/metabolite transporter (DMT)-like permease